MRKLIWLGLVAGNAMACDLKVESAWIREAPSTATSLAGYAVLGNVSNKSLTVASVQSAAFAQVHMHESLTENGMAKMRAIEQLQIPAQGKVEFTPSGKHFMLIDPKNPLRSGDNVMLKFNDGTGCETTANFIVMRTAPANVERSKLAQPNMDHSKMDHSKMDHSKMDHSTMDHSH